MSGWEVVSYGWAKKIISWDETAPGEDIMKTVEMTKDLKWYLNLVDKAGAGFERIHFNFETVLLWVKCYQTVLHVTQKLFVKKSELMQQTLLPSVFKKFPQPPQTSTDITLISQQLSKLRLNFVPAKRLQFTEGSDNG